MNIPVYYDNRVLILTDNLEASINDGFDAIHEYSSNGELKQFLLKFENTPSLSKGIIYGENSLNELFERFRRLYKFIEAAGGIIRNNKKEFLFIFRNGKWDLPKGKKEKNEKIEQTAIREVKEECGLNSVSVINTVTDTFHTYKIHNKSYLKKTSWFNMETNDTLVKAQTEEGITKVVWLKSSDLAQIKENTYRSVLDVINKI